MLPFVSYLLLIQFLEQFQSSSSLETIQAALASTIELPCSIGQNIEPTNLAKVSAGRDKCLYVFRVQFVILTSNGSKRRESECTSFQGVYNDDDIMSQTPAAQRIQIECKEREREIH